MSKHIKDAARVVCQGHALKQNVDWAIDNLRKELAIDGDRQDLAAAIHARRATDNTERMRAFRAEFKRLLLARDADDSKEATDALEIHLFGNIEK